MTSSTTSCATTEPRVSNTASAHGFIFSFSLPGRYPSSCPPTAYSGRNTSTLRCSLRSSTASSPAQRASADFPVPARPPRDTMPMLESRRWSIATRCSADRPRTPNTSRSPRTTAILPSRVTLPRAEPRGECRITPVWTGWEASTPGVARSPTTRPPSCHRSAISESVSSAVVIPVQPDSTTCWARYSSALMPRAAAFTRIGRSLETTVTSRPSAERLAATARIRVSLSPSRIPFGRVASLVWLSSTRTVPPSTPTGRGRSRRPCIMRRSSSIRSAERAKYPSSLWWRFASSSVTTTTGSTTWCSAKRRMAFGSDSRTEVSST